ncbi:MAG UNVERIFIED_CONTAM: F0F1 ATP synthase subunit B [Anaerolineae bacterium]|jgi:F-type H+-transporting ATPase subunit b
MLKINTFKGRVMLLVAVMMLVVVPVAFAAEEGAGPLAALGINGGFLIAQILNFVLVAGLLTVFLWRPLGNMLDARAAKIKKGLEDAAEAANARRNAEAEADKILAQARAEAQTVVEEGRRRGEEVAKGARAEAQQEAEKIRQDARAAAQQERDAELAGLRNQIAAISVALANRLIGESIDAQKQEALISDFFAKVPAQAKSIKGTVEVVSALPLSDTEKQRIANEINAQSVNYTVNPNILGGLILRGEDSVVDGSVRTSLNELSGRLV